MMIYELGVKVGTLIVQVDAELIEEASQTSNWLISENPNNVRRPIVAQLGTPGVAGYPRFMLFYYLTGEPGQMPTVSLCGEFLTRVEEMPALPKAPKEGDLL